MKITQLEVPSEKKREVLAFKSVHMVSEMLTAEPVL
jgi:hypothetical protein